MSLIYTPKGKAREYSPLALNIYSGGCDHGCTYCYCNGLSRGKWSDVPNRRNLKTLAKEAAEADRQILLSFVSDPYCKHDVEWQDTRRVLEILHEAGCSVAILTKGGMRALRDLDLFKTWPGGRIKVGATLTFAWQGDQEKWEPGATEYGVRWQMLRDLHMNHVKTWASVEPVIDPMQSLYCIQGTLKYCMEYKIGGYKYDRMAETFTWAAIRMIRDAGRKVYIKKDLRDMMGSWDLDDGCLWEDERDMDSLNLPDRPNPVEPGIWAWSQQRKDG